MAKATNLGPTVKITRGSEGFNQFYADLYGERWPSLKSALSEDAKVIARLNPFVVDEARARFGTTHVRELRGQFYAEIPVGQREKPGANGLADCYLMDLSSVLPALALGVQPGERVLDLCAAPGGKTLILLSCLGESGELIANEFSKERRSRLQRVLREQVPAEAMARVRVTGHDGSRWGLHEKNAFDRVLVDAPCSGERHLLHDSKELTNWSRARSRNLSIRQYALLASAWMAVKQGGRVVYSTCSISPLENDEIVAKLLKKHPGEVRILSDFNEWGEATRFGRVVLPDLGTTGNGFGPIFFSMLERI